MPKELIKKLVVIGVLVGGFGTTYTFLQDEIKEVEDCLGKDVKYSMQVVDGEQSEKVYICESNDDYTTKKTTLLQNLKDNNTKALEGVSPSIEILLIAYNDDNFFDEVVVEMLKKYDTQNHAFDANELDADFLEQRKLFFLLASKKCDGSCILEGETPNEWAYNILTN